MSIHQSVGRQTNRTHRGMGLREIPSNALTMYKHMISMTTRSHGTSTFNSAWRCHFWACWLARNNKGALLFQAFFWHFVHDYSAFSRNQLESLSTGDPGFITLNVYSSRQGGKMDRDFLLQCCYKLKLPACSYDKYLARYGLSMDFRVFSSCSCHPTTAEVNRIFNLSTLDLVFFCGFLVIMICHWSCDHVVWREKIR